jgi:protein-S-isoprenylcysteine O-methyltransferase Ste14
MLFRAAPRRSTTANAVSTVIQSVIVWGLAVGPIVLLAAERQLGVTASRFPAQSVAGVLVFVLAAAVNTSAAFAFVRWGQGTPLPTSCPRTLVFAGPYRFVRNPMAVGGIGQGIGVGLFLGSWSVLVYALTGAVFWHVAVRPAEERDLAERFGGEYDAYRSSVRLWWPRWVAYDPAERGKGYSNVAR